MTRTSPVGVVVLALVGLLAVGCSAQTSAVFETLVHPTRRSAEVDATADTGTAAPGTPTWWTHPHGYSMSLPTGWIAVGLDASTTDRLLVALGSVHPGVAQRVREVIAAGGVRASMVAVDLESGGPVPALVLVLAQEAEGVRPRQLKARVAELLASLPGLRATPVRTDERVHDIGSVRFDYVIDDPDLGALRIRSSLFRYGGQAYLVSYVAPESSAEAARTDFDLIAASLRFGI